MSEPIYHALFIHTMLNRDFAIDIYWIGKENTFILKDIFWKKSIDGFMIKKFYDFDVWHVSWKIRVNEIGTDLFFVTVKQNKRKKSEEGEK